MHKIIKVLLLALIIMLMPTMLFASITAGELLYLMTYAFMVLGGLLLSMLMMVVNAYSIYRGKNKFRYLDWFSLVLIAPQCSIEASRIINNDHVNGEAYFLPIFFLVASSIIFYQNIVIAKRKNKNA